MIAASMAAQAQRIESVAKTVESLKGQVDVIFVNFSSSEAQTVRQIHEVQKFIDQYHNGAIQCILHGGESWAQDWRKFYPLNRDRRHNYEYFLTVDDDLKYSENYVSVMVEACKAVNAPVSMHGYNLADPVASWLKSRKDKVRCLDNWKPLKHPNELETRHVIGTGAMILPRRVYTKLRLTFLPPETPNMADLNFALRYRKIDQFGKESELYVVPHAAGDIRHNPVKGGGIFEKVRDHGDWGQTYLAEQILKTIKAKNQ